MGLLQMCTNGYWAVNGTAIYVPSTVEFNNENIVGPQSGRAESGLMHIAWVRPTVRTVKLNYEHLTGYEKKWLHDLMQGKEFNFTFFDDGIQTMSGYGGKDGYTQINLNNYKNEGGEYGNYSITVVEM